MVWFWGILGILAILLLGSYFCAQAAFRVPNDLEKYLYKLPNTPQYSPYAKQVREMIDKALAIPYEDVWTTSQDGLRLHGKFYPAADPKAPVQILCHGYQSIAEKDFCGGLPMGLADGCAVLMIDQRAHGKSEGKYLTFGVKERLDCLCWIDFIRKKCVPDVKILLYGMSMGAATVLMAAGEDLPENVVGIAADCGYSSPRAIIRKVLKDRHMSVALYPVVRLGAILFAHFDPDSVGADTALERCRIPVLLVHGDDDRFVPCDMSREMYRRCGSKDKELLIIPTAGHGASYLVDYDRYRKTVSAFLQKALHREG